MQKITPFLWFNGKAEEAAKLYTSIFKNSKVMSLSRYGEAGPGPKGSVMSATFKLDGQDFYALNGGPQITFSPAVSFFVSRGTAKEIDELWASLSEGGMVFMELDKYPFSEKFGWVQDRFGISWQLNLAGSMAKIFPFLMFVGAQHGKAEEAVNFYVSRFKGSKITRIERYSKGEPGAEGTVKHAVFSLEGQEFMAMDSNREHAFAFTPGISFFVNCDTQAEIDRFWESLSAGGKKGQCGWLEDKYGVSWQIVPPILGEMLGDKDPVKSGRVMQVMMKMDKLDIEGLKKAYLGK